MERTSFGSGTSDTSMKKPEPFWKKMEKPKDNSRNECVGGVGGVFCRECGLFYDPKSPTNAHDYSSCARHLGLKGYKLL